MNTVYIEVQKLVGLGPIKWWWTVDKFFHSPCIDGALKFWHAEHKIDLKKEIMRVVVYEELPGSTLKKGKLLCILPYESLITDLHSTEDEVAQNLLILCSGKHVGTFRVWVPKSARFMPYDGSQDVAQQILLDVLPDDSNQKPYQVSWSTFFGSE